MNTHKSNVCNIYQTGITTKIVHTTTTTTT